ncbi:ABC transporter substrate-binding protein [Salinilacihabitans rarus]|uniref:ABC transporter substrate-binding protein n=1 Tax=Salinilacihabitans rarus TaxID=2961596 RepID=UPI0020C88006|nr:ABC transporter substrate-binding protein [Salinilacihabitans rarus]
MGSEDTQPNSIFDRRHVLKGLSAAGIGGLAGCLSDFTGDGGDGGDGESLDPVQDRETVNPDEIKDGGTFRVAIGEAPDSFDYPYSSSAHTTLMMNLMYEGMITTNASGEIYPWLAESYERLDVTEAGPTDYEEYMTSVPYAEDDEGNTYIDTEDQIVVSHPDNDPSEGEALILTSSGAADAVADGTYGMHYRFDLHEGIEFHNGEELTADNVVASFRRVEGSPLAGQIFDSLLHIEAEGDYTVHIYAQIPDAAFVREITGLPVYPTESTDLPPQAMDPREGNTPLGTGPFEFDEYQDEEYVVFTRNDDYWFDTELKDWFDGNADFPNGPAVEEVDIQFVQDDSNRSAALQNDEIDMTYGLTSSTLDDYQSSEGYQTSATQGAGYKFIQFPVNSEPWDDPRVRRAVNHLIPREQISENIFMGWEKPAWVPLPPLAATDGTADYDQLVEDLREYNEYSSERASELMEEVIEEKGIETPIEITIETNSDNDDRVRIVELIAESMSQSEYFEADVETIDFITFVTQLMSGEYQNEPRLAYIGLSGGFGPHGYAKSIHHPDNFMGCCNFQNIDIEELNEAMREARYGVDVVEDPDLRRQRYDEVWKLILELNANSYSTHSMTVSVTNDDVVGFNSYPSTQDLVGYGLYTPMDEQITYLDRD